MSKLQEMIEDEAARAEAENPDEEDEEAADAGEGAENAPGEPEDEKGVDDGMEAPDGSEAQPELPSALAIGPDELRKAENAIAAQKKKLTGILGSEVIAHDCVLCGGLGFLPELPPLGATFMAVEDESGPQLLAMPPEPQIELQHAPDKDTCDECDGWGQVLSGSKADYAKVTPCSKCSGNGWIMVARPEPTPMPVAPTAYAPNGVPSPAEMNMPADAWGRAWGHQHYGVHPAQIPG